jgi:hypothetical protein
MGSNPFGNTATSLIAMIGTACTLFFVVIPGFVGCGTQRYSINPDAGNVSDWSRFLAANVCRLGGEVQVAFPSNFGRAGKVAGTGGFNGVAPLPTGNQGGMPNQEWLYQNPNNDRPKIPSFNPLNPFEGFLPQSAEGNGNFPTVVQGELAGQPSNPNQQIRQVGTQYTPISK